MEINKDLIFRNMNTEIYDILAREEEFSIGLSKFVDSICNTSLNSVAPLSERETYILRKRMGVFDDGNVQSCRLVGESLESKRSESAVRQTLKKDYYEIRSYIYEQSEARLYEEKNNSASLNTRILDADIITFGLSRRSYTPLQKSEIKTMRDLIKLSTSDLIKMRYMGRRSYEEIINFVHNSGLLFADEVSKIQNHTEEIHKLLDVKNDSELQQRYNSLVSEKAQLEARSKELDLEISIVIEQLKSKNNEAKYGQSKKR